VTLATRIVSELKIEVSDRSENLYGMFCIAFKSKVKFQ
jgi:hypothetical protein